MLASTSSGLAMLGSTSLNITCQLPTPSASALSMLCPADNFERRPAHEPGLRRVDHGDGDCEKPELGANLGRDREQGENDRRERHEDVHHPHNHVIDPPGVDVGGVFPLTPHR